MPDSKPPLAAMPPDAMPPDAIIGATLEITPRHGPRLLYPAPVRNDAAGDSAKVTIDDLSLPPDWYRLKVWTSTENAVLSARVRFLEDRDRTSTRLNSSHRR